MVQSDETKLAVIGQKVDDLRDDVREVKTILGSNYVTKTEFDPIRKGFYYVVALVVAEFVSAVAYALLNWRKP